MTAIEMALQENLDALDDQIPGHREARQAITEALDALRTADTATAHARIEAAITALDSII